MTIHEFGKKEKPVLLLLPGTMCHWKGNFDGVIDKLAEDFLVSCVAYTGFDEGDILMIIGALVIAAWDGIRSGFTFWQFFMRFLALFTVYKVYDMVFFDYFWLLKFRFFQYYYPEAGDVMEGRKYGFNIKSQLLKLFVIFPAVSALAAWICSLL